MKLEFKLRLDPDKCGAKGTVEIPDEPILAMVAAIALQLRLQPLEAVMVAKNIWKETGNKL